jgi:hypothetical protein
MKPLQDDSQPPPEIRPSHQADDVVHGDQVVGSKIVIDAISTTGDGQVNVAGRDVNILQRVYNFLQGDIEAQRAMRNRQNMLQLVWNTWVEGVLRKSLHNETLIELGMQTRPDAVEHPWDMTLQMPGREPEMAAPGTTMLELFDRASLSLLILGDPGSGKTTMLLELARLAILRAQEDPLQPAPVVFNLSSWQPRQVWKGRHPLGPGQAFATWLVAELRSKYYVPEKVARPWIENDALLLLLDGLDEVSAENRQACVQAINAFQSEHSLPLAVCSRWMEYEALQTPLSLHGAVLIQALSDIQVDQYLQEIGGLGAVRRALESDAELRQFARTPLILSILALAYRDAPEEEIRALETPGDTRSQLFDAYIAQMFKRRAALQPYTPAETQKWLTWLARQMLQRQQSLFYLEDIQLGWISQSTRKIRLVSALVFGLLCGLGAGLATGMEVGLLFGVTAALLIGLSIKQAVEPTEKLRWTWRQFRVKALGISGAGLLSMLSLGVFFALARGSSSALVSGMIIGLPGWLLILLYGGLSSARVEKLSQPGEGVRASARNYALVGLAIMLTFGLVGMLMFGMVTTLIFGWTVDLAETLLSGVSFGLAMGLISGLGLGLRYGGFFLITHFAARFLLHRSGSLPFKLVPFLDYCAERIFLRKVGGGYLFIHRMLMEHFVQQGKD